MKPIQFLLFGFLTLFVAANWLPEDYEIFSLNDKIKQDLGQDTTFYSWLKLSRGPKSSLEEITKAYRKMSKQLHPDKYKGKSKKQKKLLEERFQRLSLVGNILREQGLKRRYDYFYSKGFPKWKGTGYYYLRFRPGLITTLFGLYLLVGIFHYVSLCISRKQDYKRIVNLKEQIKLQAWNGNIIPPLDGSARKVQASNGNEFHVSPVGEVSLIENDSNGMQLITLDENDINTNPSVKESVLFKLPVSLYNVTIGKLTGKKIDTSVVFQNKKKSDKPAPAPSDAKKSKKKPKGKKTELPNGKVIYSRRK